MNFQEYDPPVNEESGLADGYGYPEPGGYGSAEAHGAADEIVPSKAGAGKRRQRRSLGLIPPCTTLLVPWLLFVVVYAVTSFWLRYSAPFFCWFIVALGALLVIAFAAITVLSALRGKDPLWYGFLSVMLLIALVLGACLGTVNYTSNLRPYYDNSNMGRYEDVDPEAFSGQSMMDAGQIVFTRGARPDRTKAMGFRDRYMYCVTPITKSSGAAYDHYDFWAVGINCCTGAPHDFHCSEYDNKYAHSGLRLVDQEKQAFYRLAVQQAEAAYSIKAPHPVFLHWLQDPKSELDAYADDGVMYYLAGIFAYLAFQVVIVGIGVLLIARFG
mmetsp:Transcript_131327/g.366110  ORF Transcript_131327/g.366110 Transcript_131327/m.366110 type:complete len:328 (+) Transcript_131327:86-1069(+)